MVGVRYMVLFRQLYCRFEIISKQKLFRKLCCFLRTGLGVEQVPKAA